MPRQVITFRDILYDHGVNHYVLNDRLTAEEVWNRGKEKGSTWIDITDWSVQDLQDWLGY